MSWATVVAAVKTELEAVSGISGGAGKVLDHDPLATRPDDFVSTFKGSSILNAWIITRESYQEQQTRAGHRFVKRHGVLVRGFQPMSETPRDLSFQALVDGIADRLRGKAAVWAIQPTEPMSLDCRITEEMWSDVLCHKAEIRFSVEEIAEIT